MKKNQLHHISLNKEFGGALIEVCFAVGVIAILTIASMNIMFTYKRNNEYFNKVENDKMYIEDVMHAAARYASFCPGNSVTIQTLVNNNYLDETPVFYNIDNININYVNPGVPIIGGVADPSSVKIIFTGRISSSLEYNELKYYRDVMHVEFTKKLNDPHNHNKFTIIHRYLYPTYSTNDDNLGAYFSSNIKTNAIGGNRC